MHGWVLLVYPAWMLLHDVYRISFLRRTFLMRHMSALFAMLRLRYACT